MHVIANICRLAWALTFTFRLEPETAFKVRVVNSSVPVAVALIETACVVAPAVIVTKISMNPVLLIVLDVDVFVVNPDAPLKFNETVTVIAFALVAGFDSETRTTKVVPAT
jgi:hypothetical protein